MSKRRKKAAATLMPLSDAAKLCLSEWHHDDLDALSESITSVALKIASDALRISLEDPDTHVDFAATWSDAKGFGDGDVPHPHSERFVSPLAMRITFAQLASDDVEGFAIYEFQLGDALKDSIESCRENGSFASGLTRIAAALRSMSDDIDAAVKEGTGK